MEFKSAYSKKTRKPIKTIGKTMTQQNFKAECDINNILKKHKKTGLVSHVTQYSGRYEDLSEPVDYQTALNVVIEAQNMFDTLPSQLRKMFGNDPAEFLEFVNDPANADDLVELGLSKPIPAEPVVENPPADPVVPEPEA